jgi:anti-sigma factor RsiW
MTSNGGHHWVGTHLTCRELVELVNDYLDDALAPEVRREFERHLVTCEGCTGYLEQMRLTTRLAGRLHEDDVPAAMLDALIVSFREAR